MAALLQTTSSSAAGISLRFPRALVALATLVAAAGAGCAHRKPVADSSELQRRVEGFHKVLRWGDVGATAQFVVPDKRFDYAQARASARDEQSLRVTDYDLQAAQVNGAEASVLSKVSWHRMPSVTIRSEPMETRWVFRDGAWFIVTIRGGPVPFPVEAVAPEAAPGGAPSAAPAPEAPRPEPEADDEGAPDAAPAVPDL